MAAPSRHSAPPSGSPPRLPHAAPVGTSEARAWWRQVRACMPRGLLAALALLGLGLGLLTYWYVHA